MWKQADRAPELQLVGLWTLPGHAYVVKEYTQLVFQIIASQTLREHTCEDMKVRMGFNSLNWSHLTFRYFPLCLRASMLFPLLPLRLGGSLFPPLRIQCKNQNRERFPISSSPLSLVAAACCSFHVSFVCLLELGIALLAAACCSLISDILRQE